MRRLLLVTPNRTDPRISKRFEALRHSHEVVMCCFQRDFDVNRSTEIEATVHSLGPALDGKHLRRIPVIIKASVELRKIVDQIGDPDLGVYAMGLDCGLTATLAGASNIIMEIADVRAAGSRNPLLHLSEYLAIRNSKKIVLTSPFFFDSYLQNKYPRTLGSYLLLENKLPEAFQSMERPAMRPRVGPLKIGVFGLLRYKRPLELLLEYANTHIGKIEVLVAGRGPQTDLVRSFSSPYISYLGPYNGAGQLAALYEQVDLNFVVYDSESRNVRLALPNKLYESVFFNTPILAAEGTALGEVVSLLGVGATMNLTSAESFAESLGRLCKNINRHYGEACSQIPVESLISQDTELLSTIFDSVD